MELRTVDRAWIRATVDGRVVDEETYASGQSLRWTGQQSVLLRVGNGAGVDVTAQLLSSLPYVATIVVLVVISRNVNTIRLNSPVSLARPYRPD